MATVSEWFGRWLKTHLARHPRNDWPEGPAQKVFFDGWRQNFVRHGVTEDVAESASIRMQAEQLFPDAHLGRLIEHATAIYRERERANAGHLSDPRAMAVLESGHCPDCSDGRGGCTGWAIRYRRNSVGTVDDLGRPRGEAVVFYCRCAYGRWLLANHRERCPDVSRRIPDLDDFPFLWDAYRDPADPTGVRAVPRPRSAKPGPAAAQDRPKPAPAQQAVFAAATEDLPF